MPFEKGKKKSGGRQKGTPNRYTRFKDALLEAFNSEEIKGVYGLIDWAKLPENRGEFYRLMAKLLPRELQVRGGDGEPAAFRFDIEGARQKLLDRFNAIEERMEGKGNDKKSK
jgi:hypothetical protein